METCGFCSMEFDNMANDRCPDCFGSDCSLPTRSVVGDPIPVGEYVLDELEARGWSTGLAAAMFAPDDQVDEWHCWLELLTAVAIWQEHQFKFSTKEADRLETIFGISGQTWINLHHAYVTKRDALSN